MITVFANASGLRALPALNVVRIDKAELLPALLTVPAESWLVGPLSRPKLSIAAGAEAGTEAGWATAAHWV